MHEDTANDEDTAGATTDADTTQPQETSDLEEVRRERDALQDRLLRTAAEFDNYRKRIERDRRDYADGVTADALTDLLPIIDDLERALQTPAAGEADAFRKGVELIHRQMLELLRKRGVKAIEATGQDFDPRFHESVMSESSSAHREGEVIVELRRGYVLGDRLLRPAMVKVATA